MALTITELGGGLLTDPVANSKFMASPMKIMAYEVKWDNSYPTGGETWDLASDFPGGVHTVMAEPKAGFVFAYDKANKKLQAYQSAGFTPAGTNSKPTFTVEASGSIGANMEIGLSADSASATVEGGTGITAQRTLTSTSPVGTPTFTGTAVAAAALAEVANGVDLSTTPGTIRVSVIGWS